MRMYNPENNSKLADSSNSTNYCPH